MLLTRRFRRSLEQALESVRAELVELGVTSEAELRRAIIQAQLLVGKEKLTASDWVGRVFEVIAPDMPEVRMVERAAAKELVGLVNEFIGRGRTGPHFTDGYGNLVVVSKPFGAVQTIANVKIRRVNHPSGVDYVDRGYLMRNGDGQYLFLSCEYKTRGARGELRAQTTSRDPRLIAEDHPPGTELVFLDGSGRPGEPVDLGKIILVTGHQSPEFLRQSGAFSRIAVGAATRFRAGFATDESGAQYIRILVPVATDPMRKLLEKLLRDRSWQR